MAGTFQLSKAANGEFKFVLKAGNGQTILTSETYKAKDSAVNGIASVQKNAPDDARYDRRTSSNDKPYFVLTSTNGQVIGQSQMYAGPAEMETGIQSVKDNAPGAATDDQT